MFYICGYHVVPLSGEQAEEFGIAPSLGRVFLSSAKEFGDGRPVVELVWSAGVIRECCVGGNAECVEGCRDEVAGRDGFFAGVTGDFVAFAEDRASANASACDERTVAPGVVFASGVGGRDLRASSEFSGPDDECVVEHTAVSEVGEDSGEGLIGGRDEVVFQALEVVTVSIPEVLAIVMPVNGDEGDAVFEQSAGEEDALTVDISAIAIASGG